MNSTELLAALQTQRDKATARADELHDRIENLTADLTETKARLAELITARKVIAELAPAGHEPDPPEQATAYQTIVNAFNQHSDQTFRVRELHDFLGMPADTPAVNVTRSRLTRQGFLTQPDEAATRNGLNTL
ncbi:hypothetical protein ACFYPK_33010 [Streptomyces halstedii]|uniref:hypothetical protein n=1 Tax=Streptomyces halstedii TaxID=1944 RepID=UPI0034607ABD